MARQIQISLSSLLVCGSLRMGDLVHSLKLRWVSPQDIPGLSALAFQQGLTKCSVSQASPVPVFIKRTPQRLNSHLQARAHRLHRHLAQESPVASNWKWRSGSCVVVTTLLGSRTRFTSQSTSTECHLLPSW